MMRSQPLAIRSKGERQSLARSKDAGQSLARSKDAYVCRAVACDKQGCVSVSSASERKIVVCNKRSLSMNR